MKLKIFLGFVFAAMLGGCWFSDSDKAEVSFRFGNHAQINHQMIRLTVADGKQIWKITGADFVPDGATRSLKTATSGNLRMTFDLIDEEKSVAHGRLELPLRADWKWQVEFVPGSLNPLQTCFGCTGAKAFSLRSGYEITPADSLYVIWGGNSIKHPVVY